MLQNIRCAVLLFCRRKHWVSKLIRRHVYSVRQDRLNDNRWHHPPLVCMHVQHMYLWPSKRQPTKHTKCVAQTQFTFSKQKLLNVMHSSDRRAPHSHCHCCHCRQSFVVNILSLTRDELGKMNCRNLHIYDSVDFCDFLFNVQCVYTRDSKANRIWHARIHTHARSTPKKIQMNSQMNK